MAKQHRNRTPRKRLSPETLYWIRQGVWGVLVVSVIGLIITGVWFGTRVASLTIVEVEVYGGRTVDHSIIQQLVEDQLEGAYWRLVPRRFAWSYPQGDIYDAVMDVERVKAVLLERDGRVLRVVFDEYIPYGLWCGDATSNTECVFIDHTGYAFGQAPALVGGSMVRILVQGREPAVGESVAPRETVDTLDRYDVLLTESLGFYIATAELDSAGDAYFTLAQGGELKVALRDDPVSVVDNLASIIQSEAFSHLRPGEFQYIDLRFGNKVYVNEEVAAPNVGATTTATSSEQLR